MATSAEMAALLRHKEACAAALSSVELKIFELEESYYNETPSGNLMKGYDLYTDTREKGVLDTKKKGVARMDPELRWFTYSSYSSSKTLLSEEDAAQVPSANRSHKKKDQPLAAAKDAAAPKARSAGASRKKKRRRKGPGDSDNSDDEE
jgi:hypothetical protein